MKSVKRMYAGLLVSYALLMVIIGYIGVFWLGYQFVGGMEQHIDISFAEDGDRYNIPADSNQSTEQKPRTIIDEPDLVEKNAAETRSYLEYQDPSLHVNGYQESITRDLSEYRLLLPLVIRKSDPIEVGKDEVSDQNLNFYGIDFHEDQPRVILTIYPKNERINHGEPIVIPFYPGRYCEFGDQTACVTGYRSENSTNVIYISVHSGVGGEGERLRNAIEGTGINRASYELEKVNNKLDALSGSSITIQQGEVLVEGLTLVMAARVPAESLSEFFAQTVSEALDFASGIDPDLLDYVAPDRPQLVIETCGWKMREEAWSDEVTATTASVYLGVIQK